MARAHTVKVRLLEWPLAELLVLLVHDVRLDVAGLLLVLRSRRWRRRGQRRVIFGAGCDENSLSWQRREVTLSLWRLAWKRTATVGRCVQ